MAMKLVFLLLLSLLLPGGLAPARADDALDLVKAGGHALIMRHAQTVAGTGDPPGFLLADCATQRNLSEVGRAQARAWGRRLRAAGLEGAPVLSSQWCRCLETGRLLGLGPVQPAPSALNSFFEDRARSAPSTAALQELLQTMATARPGPVLVTHQVNITALTGLVPASGEAIILKIRPDGPPQVIARIPPP
jgi:phosphohistidine phosphatase SixA